VTSNDSKIIGSGVGGARVIVLDATTGDTLAEGIEVGSTGNTRAIMTTPRERGASVFDTDGAPKFGASLEFRVILADPKRGNVGMARASATVKGAVGPGS
jgi:hypothetical protein